MLRSCIEAVIAEIQDKEETRVIYTINHFSSQVTYPMFNFLNQPVPASFSLFSSFQHRYNTVDGKQNLLMTGFELWISGVGSNCSTN